MAASRHGALLTGVSLAVIGLVIAGSMAPAAPSGVVARQSQPEADNTVTRIAVSDNGSARWTIQIRTRLDTDERVDEYRAFQARFRNDTAEYLGPFRERMQGVVAGAANATGREMRATNFAATTSLQQVPRRWGIVTYEFTWTNVTARRNGTLVLGDIFQGGFFIGANDTLQVVAPAAYEVTRVDPAPDNREGDTVTWNGREDFADTRPRVVFAPVGSGAPEGESSDGDGSVLGDIGVPVVIGAVAVGLLGLVGVAVYRRRHEPAGAGSAEPTGTADGQTAAPDAVPPQAAETGESGEAGSPAAVMTDEERVLALLDANGGRMRQAAIAEEFDWSASKTSRVVGGMADDDSVEKLQLGRENLVALDTDEE